jgi:hypothetical protein
MLFNIPNTPHRTVSQEWPRSQSGQIKKERPKFYNAEEKTVNREDYE